MKLAICTPVYSTVMMDYASSLADMIHYTDRAEIIFNDQPSPAEFHTFMAQSSVLPQVRNALVQSALSCGANYLLWIDSDMVFPMDALIRLLSLNLPVVGANYPRRGSIIRSSAMGLDGQDLETSRESAEAGKVEEVASMGLGFCLVDMQVIHRLAEEPGPFFSLTMVDDGTQITGEDVYFFNRIRSAGFKVHVDHVLSWHLGHIVQRTLRFRDG